MTEPLSRVERAKLQRMIDKTVKASNAFFETQRALNEYARERYGAEPGDVDADHIIDGVMGGCGRSEGMTANDFDRTMRDLT